MTIIYNTRSELTSSLDLHTLYKSYKSLTVFFKVLEYVAYFSWMSLHDKSVVESLIEIMINQGPIVWKTIRDTYRDTK